MVELSTVDQKIVSSLTGWITKKAFLNAIGYLVLGIIAIFIVAGYAWWRLEKKKYNKKITANFIINGYFQPTYKDVAKSMKIGRGGFEVLYLKKLKTWKLAYGARTGVNEYTFYVLPDGYWYPGQIAADVYYINQMKGLLPVITTNPTMRSQYTSLEKQIDTLHGQKQGFWDKYGNWIMTGTFIALIGIFCWLSFREIGAFLGSGTALADQMTKLAEAMNKLAVNLNNAQPSGMIPAVLLPILT